MTKTKLEPPITNPKTSWARIENFESDKGIVALDSIEREWKAYVKLAHIETGVVKMFRLSGKDGMTYASAEVAKGAVERTWESHGGKYGKR